MGLGFREYPSAPSFGLPYYNQIVGKRVITLIVRRLLGPSLSLVVVQSCP